jgi:hypothetical protein
MVLLQGHVACAGAGPARPRLCGALRRQGLPGRHPLRTCGSSRRWSPTTSASPPKPKTGSKSRNPFPTNCARSPAAHGAISRRSPRPSRTSCRRTTSRKHRMSSSPPARLRPTSASTCCPSFPVVSSAGSPSRKPSSGWSRRSPPSTRWKSSVVTCSTGTTPTRSRRLDRATCPPSTAAISPAT